MTPKDIVKQATAELLDQRDLTAVERYWAPDYVEHSAVREAGADALRAMVGALPDGFRHERVRVFGQGDLVVTHGRYEGVDPSVMVVCDLWRVVDDLIVEHWGAHQPFVSVNPSGHSMLDGPTQITGPENTDANRTLVKEFVELIMMGGDRTQLPRFFDGDAFIQHNPLIADGVSGLGAAIQSGVWAAVVERCHWIVAEGDFVFTQGEGVLAGEPTAFYDVFRVAQGRLAEHWDVVFAQPKTLPHANGLF
jgi:predicted SnoaL-like aldol condensation-catalyzing enzyme